MDFALIMVCLAPYSKAAGLDINSFNVVDVKSGSILVPVVGAPVRPAFNPGQNGPVTKLSEKDSALCDAAFIGDAERVKKLMRSGADKNAICKTGWSVLYAAVSNSHFEVTQYLVGLGANINIKNSDEATPLHAAAYYSGPGMVLYLLENGASPDVSNKDGNTPLHLAAYHNMTENAVVLLKKGAAPSPKNIKGLTPLQIAVQKGYQEMAQTLTGFGAGMVSPAWTATVKDAYECVFYQVSNLPVAELAELPGSARKQLQKYTEEAPNSKTVAYKLFIQGKTVFVVQQERDEPEMSVAIFDANGEFIASGGSSGGPYGGSSEFHWD